MTTKQEQIDELQLTLTTTRTALQRCRSRYFKLRADMATANLQIRDLYIEIKELKSQKQHL